MKVLFTHGHRGRVPWLGLLLAVSLSTFWIPPVTAKPTVESAPRDAAEGQDVLLLVRSVTGDPLFYEWYKGATTDSSQRIVSYAVPSQTNNTGPAHSGRETLYTNGSLLIQNVTQNDTGNYTFAVSYSDGKKDTAAGQLRVHLMLDKPYIISNNSNPVEDKDTVELTCKPETQDTTYLWSINSQSLPDSPRLQLSKDNRTLTIFRVTRNDTGPYVCDTRNPVSANRSDLLTLNVLYGPDIPNISPSTTYYRPGELLNLTCKAASNPPAQYFWLFNETLESRTQELIIPNVSESYSGSYTCLAHNNATGFNNTAVRNITVSVAKPFIQASSTTVTEGKDQVVLTCLTNDTRISILWLLKNQSLQLTNNMTLSPDNRTLTINPVMREDAGDYQCEVSNGVSSNKSEPLTLTVTSVTPTTSPPTTDPGSGLSPGAIAGIVIGVLAGVALIGGLGYFLYRRRTGGTIDHRDPTDLSASNHSQERSDNVPNKGDEVAYSSLNFNAQESKKPTSPTSLTATDTVYSEVKKK